MPNAHGKSYANSKPQKQARPVHKMLRQREVKRRLREAKRRSKIHAAAFCGSTSLSFSTETQSQSGFERQRESPHLFRPLKARRQVFPLIFSKIRPFVRRKVAGRQWQRAFNSEELACYERGPGGGVFKEQVLPDKATRLRNFRTPPTKLNAAALLT